MCNFEQAKFCCEGEALQHDFLLATDTTDDVKCNATQRLTKNIFMLKVAILLCLASYVTYHTISFSVHIQGLIFAITISKEFNRYFFIFQQKKMLFTYG